MSAASRPAKLFARPIDVQVRVIGAIILREVKTRFGRERLGYIWALLEPMLLVAVFVIMMAAREKASPLGIPLTLFMLTGFVPFIAFRNTFQRLMQALGGNRALLSFPQVTVMDLVFARFLLEFATGVCVFIVLATLIAVVLREPIRVEDPLGVVMWMVVLSLMGFSLGGILGALSPVFPTIEHLVQPVLGRPLFFLSGLFFTADMIPEPFRTYLLYNPLMHIIEKLRSSFFYEFESTHAVTSYPLYWLLGMAFLALLLHRAMRNRILIASLTM